MSKNYIGLSRDHSISMRSIAPAAMRDYNSTIRVIADQSREAGQDAIVSVVKCGVGPSGAVQRDITNSSVNSLKPLSEYACTGSSTPLFDSVGDLITQLEATPDAQDASTSFMVMAITDGENNVARKWTATALMEKIRRLQATDRWTFVFRVPRGNARALSRDFGVPMGNILEWDQTDRGVQAATEATTEAFRSYYDGLKSGVRSTTKFYTNVADVDIKIVKASLTDVSAQVDLWLTSQKEVIKDFCERKSKAGFVKGAAFYQLIKPEREVQDYKQIMLRDKVSGAVYGGAAARQLLGLPSFGTHPVAPGDHGQYDIYIQSTSVNRVLPPGTQLLYWPKYNEPIVPTSVKLATKPAPVRQPSLPTSSVAIPTNHPRDYIAGYILGFDDGKQKSSRTAAWLLQHSARCMNTDHGQFTAGFNAGYKDGRGKKKRLYK